MLVQLRPSFTSELGVSPCAVTSFDPSVLLSVLALVGLFAASGPGNAATVSGSCPTAATESTTGGSYLPPFPAGTAITQLVGCTTPYVSATNSTDVHLTYGDLGVTDDGCSTVSALSLTSTGNPSGAGWGIIAYNTSTNAVVPTTTTGDQGYYQQFGAAAGTVLPVGGVNFLSPSLQPASGSYAITGDLDPSSISLADLAAGHLGITAVVLNTDPDDTLTSITVSVTTDSTACEPTSSTTSTTSTTLATTTTATAAAAPATEATPAFTG